MAFNTAIMQHPQTNQVKRAPIGFSWTTFFFSIFPALLRGDFKWFFIMILTSLPTLGLSAWVYCFLYNKFYIQDLLKAGYVVSGFEKTISSEAQLAFKMGVSEIPYLKPQNKLASNSPN